MRWIAPLVFAIAIASGQAQDARTFTFSGTVKGFNPGSTFFSGVTVGTPVQGTFTLDASAVDSNPGAGFGTYSSSVMGFSGTIGSHSFSTVPSAGNGVNVDPNDPPMAEDFLIIIGSPNPAMGASQLQLTFFDPNGASIQNDALPLSYEQFNLFPNLDLFVSGGGNFGQYNFDFTVVPEPSSAAVGLVGMGVFILSALRLKNR